MVLATLTRELHVAEVEDKIMCDNVQGMLLEIVQEERGATAREAKAAAAAAVDHADERSRLEAAMRGEREALGWELRDAERSLQLMTRSRDQAVEEGRVQVALLKQQVAHVEWEHQSTEAALREEQDEKHAYSERARARIHELVESQEAAESQVRWRDGRMLMHTNTGTVARAYTAPANRFVSRPPHGHPCSGRPPLHTHPHPSTHPPHHTYHTTSTTHTTGQATRTLASNSTHPTTPPRYLPGSKSTPASEPLLLPSTLPPREPVSVQPLSSRQAAKLELKLEQEGREKTTSQAMMAGKLARLRKLQELALGVKPNESDLVPPSPSRTRTQLRNVVSAARAQHGRPVQHGGRSSAGRSRSTPSFNAHSQQDPTAVRSRGLLYSEVTKARLG